MLASDIPRQWEWNIHALNPMTVVSDQQISIENNGQRLCVDMLAGPTMRFTQTNLFTADPGGNVPQWHGNFYSVNLLGAAEFIALLNVGCTAITATPCTTAAASTVPVGNTTATASAAAITVEADTPAPAVPTGLAASALTATSLTLTWSAATDNVGVTGYRLYRDATLVASAAGTSASLSGLSPSTPYTFTVAALDAAGNASAPSAPLSVTTPALSVTTPAPPAPFSGTPIAIPGTFEAENFDLGGEGIGYHDVTPGNAGGQYRVSEDVDIILSADALGGGYVVNNFETGEWLAYTVNVAASALYDIEIRASSMFSTSAFHVEIDGVSVTGTITVPNTGSWSAFQWVGKKAVTLAAGKHVLKIVSDQQYFNFNSIRVTAARGPYSGTPIALPGSIEAEDFDLGGEGVAYHDNVKGNAGGQYRLNEDVDIIVSTDSAGGGYVVSNFETGEWLAYTINVATSGNYDIELRAATNWDFPNSAYHVEIDGVNVTGSVVLPNTGGWSAFQWVGKKTVSLSAGTHVLKLVSDRQYFNVNQIRILAPLAAPAPGSAQLLFGSGFEDLTAVSPVSNFFGTGAWQGIVGADTTTGFTLPINVWCGTTKLQLI